MAARHGARRVLEVLAVPSLAATLPLAAPMREAASTVPLNSRNSTRFSRYSSTTETIKV